jgi:mannose-6-phosphate isomerase-like protein (cupin superfamily)
MNSLSTTYVVMNDEFRVDELPVTDSIYAELDERYNGFRDHLLISCHSFEGDWPTWEVHAHGDELVCLVAGDADMILRTDEGDIVRRLTDPGTYVIVPANTWHTARVRARTTMIFVTPGEATLNRESPQ